MVAVLKEQYINIPKSHSPTVVYTSPIQAGLLPMNSLLQSSIKYPFQLHLSYLFCET